MKLAFMLLRHGKTVSNIMGRYTGREDDPLCQEGRNELERLAENFDGRGLPDILFSSPMKRCMETSAILFPGMKPVVVDDLKEIDFGVFEGKTYRELEACPEFRIFNESGWKGPIPGGENPEDFNKRCLKGFKEAVSYMLEKNVSNGAAVCHGGVIMSLCSSLLREPGSFYDYYVENGRGYETVYDTVSGFMEIMGKI